MNDDSTNPSDAEVVRAAFCPGCGTAAQTGWRFCAACGIELPVLAAPAVRAPGTTPPTTPPATSHEESHDPPTNDEAPLHLWSDELTVDESSDDWAAMPVWDSTDGHQPVERTDATATDPRPAGAPPDVSTRARRAQLALLLAAGSAVAMVVSLFVLNRRLDRADSTASIRSAEDWVDLVWQPIFLVTTALGLVGLALWLGALRAARSRLGGPEPRWSDTVATWAWLVPGVNLALGPSLLLDAENAAAQRPGSRRTHRALMWGWALLCAAGAAVAVTAAVSSPASVAGSLDANVWSAVGYALLGAGYLVLVVAVAGVTHLTLAALHDQDGPVRTPAPRADLLTSIAGVDRPHMPADLAELEELEPTPS